MSEVIVITSGKRRRRQNDYLRKCGNRPCHTGEESGADRYRYRPQEPGRGDGTGKPHCIYLVDVVEGGCRIKQALIKDKNHQGLYLMPSAQTRDKSSVTPQQMKS